jgi:hypothetical protein
MTMVMDAPVAVACRECGHRWQSSAKHGSVVRCPLCGHAERVKRPVTTVSTPMGDVLGTVASPPLPAQSPRHDLIPSVAVPCDMCVSAGKRDRSGRYPRASWRVGITLADGSVQDGMVCGACAARMLSGLAGRGARVRLDPL